MRFKDHPVKVSVNMALVQRQSTIKTPIAYEGVVLHGGQHTRMLMRPAPIGTGLVFVRTDGLSDNHIQVCSESVAKSVNCTTLENSSGVKISTVEHLLAALSAAGIDNLFIEVAGDEVPAGDGSSAPFLDLIDKAGILSQPAPRRYIKILKTIEVRENDSWAKIEPASRLELDVTIDFEDSAIGYQSLEIIPDVRSFRKGLASARTFARMHEVAALQSAGLSKGGSLENAIVVDGDKILNPEGLRYTDEFVRHKALDLMGDVYIVGPILGRITAFKSGHRLNHALMTALNNTPHAWKYVTLPHYDADYTQESVSA